MQNRYESYTVAPERRSNEITKEWEKRLKGSKTYHCRRSITRVMENISKSIGTSATRVVADGFKG